MGRRFLSYCEINLGGATTPAGSVPIHEAYAGSKLALYRIARARACVLGLHRVRRTRLANEQLFGLACYSKYYSGCVQQATILACLHRDIKCFASAAD
jgi:hypothetical protein